MGQREVQQTIGSVSVEGLEHVFEAGDTQSQDEPQTQPTTGQPTTEVIDSPAQDWTVAEAARFLAVSEKTILRRLQRGTLGGYKVAGQFGPEWRINQTPLDTRTQDKPQAQPTAGQVVAEVIDSPAQDWLIDQLQDEVSALRKQLEGAIYRNGYLEAKLEERDSTIKLLTDSQHHKHGWWHRFSAWIAHH